MTESTRHTVRIALAVSLGGFVFGFDASVISGTIRFVMAEFQLSDLDIGLMVGAPTLGGLIASLAVSPLADLYGRRTILLVLASLYCVSAVMSAMATSYDFLVAARFIGGMAFGSLGLAPIYISEVASAKSRGRMVSFNQLNIVFGLSAAYFVNYLVLQYSTSGAAWVEQLGINDNQWRWMLGIEAIPAFLWLLLLMRVPESPRWLIINNQEQKGRSILEKLELDTTLEEEVKSILASAQDGVSSLSERVKVVFSPRLRFALLIGIVLAAAQQITGVNAIYFYAPSVFEQSGIGTDAAFAQAVAVGITNIIFTVVAMLLIDKLGRKPLLIMGLSGVFLSMTLCAWAFGNASYQLKSENIAAIESSELRAGLVALEGQTFESDIAFKSALKQTLGEKVARESESELLQAAININPNLVLVGILGFVASFAISLGPVMWVMLPEIFPNQVRGVAMAVTGLVNGGVSFGVQFLFPWELNTIGASYTFLIYGLFALFFLILVVKLVPETRNKTLEELEAELAPLR